MAMGRDDGLVNSVDMLHEILDFLIVLLRQTVACCVRNIDDGGSSLNNGLDNTCQILIVGTPGILTVELNVINKLAGIFRGGYSALNNLFAG